MILKRIILNCGEGDPTNCYIVADEKSKEAFIIDPGGEPEKVIDMISILKVNVKYIILTHCHGDHIAGVREVNDKVGGKILIHRMDAEGLCNENLSLTYYIGLQNPDMEPDSILDDDDKIHLGDIEFDILHTPGHTKGGICIYCPEQKMIFTGDTLFRGTWGRTDLPTGSFEDIIHSITNRIMVLPEDTIIYPGHGKSTIVKEEERIYLDLKARE